MKQYHIFFEAERFLLDKTELEERKGELTVMILSSIRDEYTKEIYRQDVEEAVHLHIPDIWKFIFWKHTKETTLYNKLYSEFESSYKEENIPLSVRYGIDFNVKYFCHYFNVGILGQYDESLIDALDKEDVLKYFSFIEYLDEYQFSNPDPRYFDAILKSAKVKAENIPPRAIRRLLCKALPRTKEIRQPTFTCKFCDFRNQA